MKAYERFLEYVKYDTTSDEYAPEDRIPSTEKQLVLADRLAEELKAIGFADARRDRYGYVYASAPSNCGGGLPAVGLIAHMDTSSAASGADVKARIVRNYDGGDILLNAEKQIYLRPSQFDALTGCVGDDLIVTDGTTLLGGDDKAGIAEIMEAAERILSQNLPHGKISVAFTPDEEIGRGGAHFDLDAFGADFAYTVDGGKTGELENETFNAASAVLTVHGVSTHPGDGKNRLKNASLLAMEFHSMLPPAEVPEHTEGREGFYFLEDMKGETERAVFRYIVRDHDKAKFEARKQYLRRAADYLTAKYGPGVFELDIKDSYYNMREIIDAHPEVTDRAEKAMRACGQEPVFVPIRGGTDGSFLSWKGLPCPNLPTGAFNLHGRFEFVSVTQMETMADTLTELLKKQ